MKGSALPLVCRWYGRVPKWRASRRARTSRKATAQRRSLALRAESCLCSRIQAQSCRLGVDRRACSHAQRQVKSHSATTRKAGRAARAIRLSGDTHPIARQPPGTASPRIAHPLGPSSGIIHRDSRRDLGRSSALLSGSLATVGSLSGAYLAELY